MNLKEIQAAAAALGTQLKAGIPMAEALRRMARLQPGYADFWASAAEGAAAGRRLTVYLKDEWPDVFVSAMKAGEDSGTLPATCVRIKETVALHRENQKKLWKLAYPAGLIVLALAVFVFFMTSVLPALAQSLGSGEHGFVFDLSQWMSNTLDEHWVGLLVGLVVISGLALGWLSVYENREQLVDLSLSIPVLGQSLEFFYWGLWAHYMSLIDSTGAIARSQALIMTSAMLPASLRPGLLAMAAEVDIRGSADASDPAKQADGDPRKDWPYYVGNAFMVADTSGVLDVELIGAATAMIEEGTTTFNIVIDLASVGALILTAVFVALPLVAYFVQLGAAMQAAMRG